MMIKALMLVLGMFGFTLIELSAKLADRAGKDDEFRDRLKKEPESVLEEELGRAPTPAEVAEFRRLLQNR